MDTLRLMSRKISLPVNPVEQHSEVKAEQT